MMAILDIPIQVVSRLSIYADNNKASILHLSPKGYRKSNTEHAFAIHVSLTPNFCHFHTQFTFPM